MNSEELEAHLIECLPNDGRLSDVRSRVESKFPKSAASTQIVALAFARKLISELNSMLRGEAGNQNSREQTSRQVENHHFVDLWAEYIANRRLVCEALARPEPVLLKVISRKMKQLNLHLVEQLAQKRGYAVMAPAGDFLRDL